jgi:phage-related protein
VPIIRVVFFQDDGGTVPLLLWLDGLPRKARAKCIARIQRLNQLGYELRRPEADFLRDGIYELRVGLQGVNYRMLYFFHGQDVAVVSHGLVKERIVPPREIDLAIEHRRLFESDEEAHSFEEGPDDA